MQFFFAPILKKRTVVRLCESSMSLSSGSSVLIVQLLKLYYSLPVKILGGFPMAAVTNISYSFDDGGPRRQTMIVPVLGTGYTLAQLTTFAGSIGDLIGALSNSAIAGVSITINIDSTGVGKDAPVPPVENELGGLFSFSAADTNYNSSVRIPGFIEGKFSGESVDTDDADVIAFRTAMTAGLDISGTQVTPTDRYGNDLDGALGTSKSFRRK